MKITELIQKLHQIKLEHGDLDICYADRAEGGSVDVNNVTTPRPYKVVNNKMQWGVEDKDQAPVVVVLD